MGNTIKAGARAQRTFSALAALTGDASGAKQRSELLAAKVPAHTVAALYPFDLAEHLPALRETLNVRRTFQGLAPLFYRTHVGDAINTLPAGEQALISRANLPARVISRGLKFQRSSAYPNFSSAEAAYLWVDLLLYFYACSQLSTLPRDSPAARKLHANEEIARKLVQKLNQLQSGA